eukprot:TRINITY_DN4117_c0_g2_i2.p4 TRINITY_DN4117_c0_g2~~TRINITY_DN4117_c0_g2_i2.p4  ORF type:complete len:142 (+),score=30.19 TRINITY_DN4117_c0_g2_i2:313-738(+)
MDGIMSMNGVDPQSNPASTLSAPSPDARVVLDQLNQLEQKVVDLLELSSRTVNALVGGDVAVVNTELKQNTESFVRGAEELKSQLLEHLVHLSVTDSQTPYRNAISVYGARKQTEISAAKTTVVRAQLEAMLHLNAAPFPS